jgi:hypothetical protein
MSGCMRVLRGGGNLTRSERVFPSMIPQTSPSIALFIYLITLYIPRSSLSFRPLSHHAVLQEFLEVLFHGLHESLNQVRIKP